VKSHRKKRTLEKLEVEASEDKQGLWIDLQPVPPWEWRKRKERSRALSAAKSSMFSGLTKTVTEPPQPTVSFQLIHP